MENKKAKKIETVTFTVAKKFKCIISQPDFEQLSMALTALVTTSGNRDMAGAGKVIFDLCKVSCDKEIEKSPNYLLFLCLQIAGEYLEEVEVEIKKN